MGFSQTDTEFWFVAPEVAYAHGDRPIYLRLTAFDENASIVVSQPANSAFAPINITIPAFGTVSVDLTPYIDIVENKPPDQINPYGLHIQSSKPITAYYEEANDWNSDIFTLKGINSLGTSFYIPSQNTFPNDSRFDAYNSFDIVATEDNTQILITPSNDIVGHLMGITFTIVLNKGQTYCAQATSQNPENHLMGSRVVSNKPIAITFKDDSVNVLGGADLNGDQIVPENIIGKEYIIVRGYLTTSVDDQVYVLSAGDNNSVFLNGNSIAVATLNRGGMYSFSISTSNPVAYLVSDKPVYVQHLTGFGPESASALLPTIECTGSSRVAFTRSSSDNFTLTIVTEDGSQGNFNIDGNTTLVNATQFQPVPGTLNPQRVYARVVLSAADLPIGPHVITNSSNIFQMGIINASPGNIGCRYGYFSDYARLNLGTDETICAGESKLLDAGNGWNSYMWSTGATTQTITVTTTGSYWVTVSNPICSISDTIQVTSIPIPQITNNPLNKNICNGASTMISLFSNQPATTFSWIASGSTSLISGYSSDSGQIINQILTNAGSSTETVTYTVTPYIGNCAGTPVDFIVSVMDSSIYTHDTVVCTGDLIHLNSKSALSYNWFPSNGLSNTAIQNPTLVAGISRKYYLQTTEITNNLVDNGDFEQGNIGFLSSYGYSSNLVPEGLYYITTNPQFTHPGFSPCSDHTSGLGNMMVINGATTPNLSVWSTNIAVLPNTDYAFSAWATNVSSSTSVLALLQFSINNSPIGSVFSPLPNQCTWSQFYIIWNSGSNTTANINLLNQNTIGGGNDFALDDISFGEIISCVDSINIDVLPCAPIVFFTPCFDTITSTGAKPFKIKGGLPSGGVYSGAGVNTLTNMFDPMVAGSGQKVITYTYTNAAMQTASATRSIMVWPTSSFSCGNNLSDIRDNKIYPTIQIGTQCWLASNLNYGVLIPFKQSQLDNCTVEKYCYNDIPGNCAISGGYYQWDEMMQYENITEKQGICPPEWHIPSENNWNQLVNFYQGEALAGRYLKDSGSLGFNAILLGNLYLNNTWSFTGFATFFWTSTTFGTDRSLAHGLNDPDPSISYYPSLRANAFFIRCIHD